VSDGCPGADVDGQELGVAPNPGDIIGGEQFKGTDAQMAAVVEASDNALVLQLVKERADDAEMEPVQFGVVFILRHLAEDLVACDGY